MPEDNARTATPTLPPRIRGWLAVVTVMIVAFIAVTTEFLPVGLLDDIARSLGISVGQAGLMITVPAIVAAIAAPVVVVATGRLDRRWLIIVLTFLLAVSNVLVATAHGLPQLLAGRALVGIVVGGFWPIVVVIPPRLVEARSVARAISVVFVGVTLATVVGVPIGTLLGNAVGWRDAFLVAGGVALLATVVELVLLPSMVATSAVSTSDIPRVFRTRMGLVGLGATLGFTAAHFTAYTYIQPFLSKVVDASEHQIGLLLFVFGGAGAISNIVGGMFAARHLRGAIIGAFAVTAVPTLLMGIFGATSVTATIAIATWGLGFGAAPMLLTIWMARSLPDAPEAAGAMFVTTFQVGISSGSLIGGAILGVATSQSTMLTGGLIAGAAVVLMVATGRQPSNVVTAN